MRSNVPGTVALVPLTVAEPVPAEGEYDTVHLSAVVSAVSPLEVDAIALWFVPVP